MNLFVEYLAFAIIFHPFLSNVAYFSRYLNLFAKVSTFASIFHPVSSDSFHYILLTHQPIFHYFFSRIVCFILAPNLCFFLGNAAVLYNGFLLFLICFFFLVSNACLGTGFLHLYFVVYIVFIVFLEVEKNRLNMYVLARLSVPNAEDGEEEEEEREVEEQWKEE